MALMTRKSKTTKQDSNERDQLPQERAGAWYADPFGEGKLRWWDGKRWTSDVHEPAEHPRAEAEPGEAHEPAETRGAGPAIDLAAQQEDDTPTLAAAPTIESASAPPTAEGLPLPSSGGHSFKGFAQATSNTAEQDAEPAVVPAELATSAVGRVCPQCLGQAYTSGEYCPHCGAPYVRRPDRNRGSSRRAKVIAGGVGLLLIGGGATGVLLKIQHDNNVAAKHEQQKAQARRQAAVRAAAQAAVQAAAKAATDQANQEKRALRAGIVTSLQDSITKDANDRITQGVLNGPAVTSTTCTPLGGGSTDDLTAHTGTFTCLAVDQTNSDGTQQGYGFSATVNYDSGSYTWHLGN